MQPSKDGFVTHNHSQSSALPETESGTQRGATARLAKAVGEAVDKGIE